MKKILIICCVALLFFSCKKEKPMPTEPILGLGGYHFTPTYIDDYIQENFVTPYNIDVKYRWDPYEVNIEKPLVPPREEKVIPVLEVVLKGWIEPYKAVAGAAFLQKYSFSKFNLVGSFEHNTDGTIVLGTAEGGAEIVLLGVNHYSSSKLDSIQEYLYTIHHEFGHILHQTHLFPQSWRAIEGNNKYYTSTWSNTETVEAQKQGFVRNYAKLNMNEDFVETIAFLLVKGQPAYDKLVTDNAKAAGTFRKKEEIVVNYFRDVVGIDFRDLQKRVQDAIQTINKKP